MQFLTDHKLNSPPSEIIHPEIGRFMFNTVVFDVGKIVPQSYK